MGFYIKKNLKINYKMDQLYNLCQQNVKFNEKKIRKDIDIKINKNKKDAEKASKYLFNKLISERIFNSKVKKASFEGKKRVIIFKYSIIERIFIPEISRSFNIDTLIDGSKGPDVGTISRFRVEPIFQKFQSYIEPFKSKLIKDNRMKYIEVSWE